MTTLGRLLCCLFILVPGFAWGGNGGSTYSRFGLGDIRYGYSAQSLGMGSGGIAVRSSSAIDPLNPAGWSAISRTRYAIGALYEGYSVSDGASSTYLSSAEFNGAMIAVPLSTANGIVFAGGITPYSRVNYNAIDTTASQGGLDYTLRFRGNGGVSAAHAGLSVSVSEDLQAGAKIQYYFGTIRHIVDQEFSTSDYSNASVERSTQFRGIGGTFGLIYTGLSKTLGLEENARFGVGAFLSTGSKLTATQDDFLTYVNGGVTTRDTATVAEHSVRLPVSCGLGLSYATERLVVAADVQTQNWNDFTVDGVHPIEIRNSVRMSAGVEFLPKREPGLPYSQRLSYRAGTFYHQTTYRIKNEPINEFGLSGGISLPITGETRLHIGAEYAMRGTTDLQLQKDNILRLSFTVTGGELWFTRPPEE
jgi:hypothetical protein